MTIQPIRSLDSHTAIHIRNTFHKQERLCSKKQMELLFSKGNSLSAYPVKMIVAQTPVDLVYPVQAMFVVPKRNFKKSPDRNTLKRRMRETYRLGKGEFYKRIESRQVKLIIAFIYIGKKEENYASIEKAMNKLLSAVNF